MVPRTPQQIIEYLKEKSQQSYEDASNIRQLFPILRSISGHDSLVLSRMSEAKYEDGMVFAEAAKLISASIKDNQT